MKKMKVLGCTGGIGSGKSFVARIFGELGYPVYFSDDRAKLLYDRDPVLLQRMVELMGEGILSGGKLDRGAMAARIFADRTLLAEVERAVHPAVLRDFSRWKEELEARPGEVPDFVLFESAILAEKPRVLEAADKVLHIVAPYELRISRVMARDGVSREQVLQRLDRQWTDSQRAVFADFTIFADSKRALLPQIAAVINKMKSI